MKHNSPNEAIVCKSVGIRKALRTAIEAVDLAHVFGCAPKPQQAVGIAQVPEQTTGKPVQAESNRVVA